MTDPTWIRTPHGVEQVEAVVQYAEDGSNARQLMATLGCSDEDFEALERRGGVGWTKGFWVIMELDGEVYEVDTDPRIEPEWEPVRYDNAPTRAYTHRYPVFRFTLNNQPWVLIGPDQEVK